MPKSGKHNAIAMLKEDHAKVKDLFDQFENSDNKKTKTKIAQEAIQELKIHSVLEEEIFYPAVREAIEDEENIMNEAEEEHHVAKLLIAELEQMGQEDEHFDAKFEVLSESIRHHIKEEEGEMLPEAKKTDVDFEALGEQMRQRKEQLMSEGLPPSKEEELVSASK